MFLGSWECLIPFQRGAYGEERYEKVEFQRKVREQFMKLRAESENSVKWYVLDASKSKEELHSEILAIALKTIEAAQWSPLNKLWN